jgi:hypothetical protein
LAEISLTQMLDKPASGRIFFEQIIRDNRDLGRPDRVSLIFGRSIYRGRKNHTPGIFATRVLTSPTEPACVLQAHQDQAVPQGRTSAAHRDHDQPHYLRQLTHMTRREHPRRDSDGARDIDRDTLGHTRPRLSGRSWRVP